MLRSVQRLFMVKSKIRIIKYRCGITSVPKPIPHYLPQCLNKALSYSGNPKVTFGLWGISILTWLGFAAEDEGKESELIMTLKRAVLSIRKEQFNTAEQLLHLALKIAQEQQNEQGIVYCYDLMANLAFDQQRYDQSEKLFVAVLKSLLSEGTKQEDIRVIHISLKIARIAHLKADYDKAKLGYQWCLEKIEHQKDENLDTKMLCGVIQDWYAQFLLDLGENEKALFYLKEAYKICEKTMEAYNEKSMLLLNDIGITCFRAGDITTAKQFLNRGINIGHKVDDQRYVGVLHANLGLVLLQQGIIDEAEKSCKIAWRLGRKNMNNETMDQANYCFEQIQMNLKN